jgi:hypothetical protein
MDNNPLKQLADNPFLLNVVKEHLLKYFDYTSKPTNLSFEALGMWITTQDEGRAAILSAIRDIENLRTVKEVEVENPAV